MLTLDDVKKLSPKPGDVLIAYCSEGVSTNEVYEALSEMRVSGWVGCPLIVAPSGVSLALLDEAAMNAAGWVRKEVVPDAVAIGESK